MITLYELHWSHYCEKVRWALDFKQLPWKKTNINAFTKKEIMHNINESGCRLVPFIYDNKTSIAMQDSTPILRYLESIYPAAPALFPTEQQQHELADKWLLELDSKLGISARRLGYTQLILEKSTILAILFLPKYCASTDIPSVGNN